MTHRSKAVALCATLAVLSGTAPAPTQAAQVGSCGWIPYGWSDYYHAARHGGSGASIENLVPNPLEDHDNLHASDMAGAPLDHDHWWTCGEER